MDDSRNEQVDGSWNECFSINNNSSLFLFENHVHIVWCMFVWFHLITLTSIKP